MSSEQRILISTRDKPDGGIDSQNVKEIIEKVIKASDCSTQF